ncbi:acylneuraminate cytidylyltransferase family protein [bacterium]|nr:acylneuraminate cytidylyltransferase family protein [bacterium]
MKTDPILTIIPARGGSKGLPGKNIRPLAGLPLIAHSIKCAQMCPELDRIIVSTDNADIRNIALQYGAAVPFLRPAELAGDTTPMIPVLQHALQTIEALDNCHYQTILLLDPTSPGRFPDDISAALVKLADDPQADGIIGVSEPDFNPIWHCVREEKQYLKPLFDNASQYTRRQDVPPVYRINATLYLWRRTFLLETNPTWITQGNFLLQQIPENRSIHIDHLDEFDKAEILINSGLIRLPWLS